MTAARQPLPNAVLRLYRQEVARSGSRGAYRRTAERIGRSPERVRQIVAEDRRQTEVMLAQLVLAVPYVTLERKLSVSLPNASPPTKRHGSALIPHDFRADAHNAVWWSRMVSWMVVVWWCSGLLARQDWRLSALTLIPVLFWWHVVAVCARDYRRLKG